MIERMEIIGKHVLYLGDAYRIAPGLGVMDAVVTDPPYLFSTSGGGKFRKARKCLDAIGEQRLDRGFDHSILNTLLYKAVFVFCHNGQLPVLLPYLAGSFRRFAVISWHKTNPQPVANKNYLPDTEFYIHAWNDGGHPAGEIAEKKRYIVSANGKSKFDHPTVKPLSVMEKIIANVNGHSVLDPFMGTGSTGVAAIAGGKRFFGIENNEKHFHTACVRIREAVRAGRKEAA